MFEWETVRTNARMLRSCGWEWLRKAPNGRIDGIYIYIYFIRDKLYNITWVQTTVSTCLNSFLASLLISPHSRRLPLSACPPASSAHPGASSRWKRWKRGTNIHIELLEVDVHYFFDQKWCHHVSWIFGHKRWLKARLAVISHVSRNSLVLTDVKGMRRYWQYRSKLMVWQRLHYQNGSIYSPRDRAVLSR